MRLRLSVQRHKLPPTNVLWSVPDSVSPLAYTIARLLEDVNTTIPLEAEHWGLEDYAVEVGGFECLHFSPVSRTLKDEDQVLIRPLLTAEVRSRTLCGRYQISDGGQHLVDGVPFGRPLLRPPIRPHVRIPPRKRQRLLEDTAGGDENDAIARLITANGEMSPPTNGDSGRTSVGSSQRRQHNGKSVHFGKLPEEEADSEEDEDDEDFAPEGASDTSTPDDSEDETGGSSDVDDTSSSGFDSDSDDTSSSRSDTESSSVSESEVESVGSDRVSPGGRKTKSAGPHVPPGKGLKVTKNRNKRRAEAKKLKRLKASGVLPVDATVEDLRNLTRPQAEELQTHGEDMPEGLPTLRTGNLTRKRKRDSAEDTAQTLSDTEQTAANREATEDTETKQHKQELTGRMAVEPPRAATVERPSPESARKRMQPDVSAISRILSHQARQLDKSSPKSKRVAPVEEPEAPPDPDFWKSRINLSAFECWEEEHTLSAPPFPFKQHWDPASQLMREKSKKKQKNRGGRTSSQRASTVPDKNDDSVLLDYGDPLESNGNPNASQAEGDASAAIESQLLQDVATAAKTDLPPLPDDVNALPALSQSDIKRGAIIVFKLFIINPVNMNPEISSFKTAIVEEEGDSGNGAGVIGLKLAERDVVRKVKKFDKQGNRIYDSMDKFQMGDSDDEDDDGLLYHHLGELLEPKLLKAA